MSCSLAISSSDCQNAFSRLTLVLRPAIETACLFPVDLATKTCLTAHWPQPLSAWRCTHGKQGQPRPESNPACVAQSRHLS